MLEQLGVAIRAGGGLQTDPEQLQRLRKLEDPTDP
jgi:hypothetical protein